MIASRRWAPWVSSRRMRTPFVTGSIGGEVGTVMRPLRRSRSSPPGGFRFRILILALVAKTGTMLVHGSQASPMPSWSLSACDGFGTVGQLSCRSQTPSPSLSASLTSAGQVTAAPVQRSAGSQGPAAGRQTPVLFTSAGQLALAPVQLSAGSQVPADGRHTVEAGWNASGGQSLPTPSQLSATSQGPAAGRQTPVLFTSAGQLALAPVQLSAGSQVPADGRHTVEAGWNASGGQSLPTPSQLSAASQGPAAGRQTPVLFTSAGQLALAPVQLAAGSQVPADGRHTVEAGWNASGGQSLPTPSQ